MMGGKVAKFGFFSPAVIVAKVLLGEQKLNKVRGCGDGGERREGGREKRDGAVFWKRGWAMRVGMYFIYVKVGSATLSDE